MSLRQETFDLVCVSLEECQGQDIEAIAADILHILELQGDDLMEHLDPPTGLQTWLRSHGLSLVATTEVVPPRVWDALGAEEVIQGTDREDLEEQEEDEIPSLQVGDYVEYQTAPRGPNQVQQMGAGWVREIGEGFIWVRTGAADAYIVPQEGDVIRLVRPAAPEHSAQAPPW